MVKCTPSVVRCSHSPESIFLVISEYNDLVGSTNAIIHDIKCDMLLWETFFCHNQSAFCGSCFSWDRGIQYVPYARSYRAGLQESKETCKFLLFFIKYQPFVGLNDHWKVTYKRSMGHTAHPRNSSINFSSYHDIKDRMFNFVEMSPAAYL